MWRPIGMKECSRTCPAVGELLDVIVGAESCHIWWRCAAVVSMLLNAALIARALGWI